MNEFLQQFAIESRELVVQATEGLLVLERAPDNAELLDSVFRAFHTLKGGAGIVDFAAMEHRVHAAENLLSRVRAGERQLDVNMVGACLTCLDEVSQWLDVLEQTGELPAIDKAPATLGGADGGTEGRPKLQEDGLGWVEDLLNRHAASRARARSAFRLVPDPGCFYQGEDPLARVSRLQKLLALEVEPAIPWPALDELDTYTCNLILTGLTDATQHDVQSHLQDFSGAYEVVALQSASATQPIGAPQSAGATQSAGAAQLAGATQSGGILGDSARKVLKEQILLLREHTAHNAAGCIASAGAVAANVMRSCGRLTEAEALVTATERSLSERASTVLRDAIAALLAPITDLRADAAGTVKRTADTSARTLRVDADRIDALVRLVGELTVAGNSVGHTAMLAQDSGDSTALLQKNHHGVIARLISELQTSIIGMRVLPLRLVFQRFPRVLREMSLSLGKPIKLNIEGEDTEADKTIVDMLFEPLLHIVRNAIDHGVESPAQRLQRGKAAEAMIRIRAAREGDRVSVEISDDGGGIDVARVRQVAKARGVATETDLETMSESDILNLIFAPGFSTAEKVTELSGRGVGMDAVRTAVEKVGGRVSIASVPGAGTTVRFLLPFSVMMTEVMTMEAGGQAFGVPLDVIMETVRVPTAALSGVGHAQVFSHRGRTVVMLELAQLLNPGREATYDEDSDATVVIANVGGQSVGIRIDRPGVRMKIILEPLNGLLAGTPGIAGTTLLGDGRVLLVLDIVEMLQ